jgi:hypothetical protein
MSGRIRLAGALVFVALALLVTSCAKISEPTAVPGGIPEETLASRGTLPAAWGDLVSVSSVSEYPELVQLWFRGTDGTVRYAVVSLRTHEILNAHVIRRAQEVAS